MPKRKGRIRITPTKDKGATPNKKNLRQGAIGMLVIITKIGATPMANNAKGRTKTFKLTSLMPCAMNKDIILTFSPNR
jgi:hypothetical protein